MRAVSFLSNLDGERHNLVTCVVEALLRAEPIHGVVLCGSLLTQFFDDFSDVDVVAFTDTANRGVVRELLAEALVGRPVFLQGETRRFSWFGQLHSIYFASPYLFALDVGELVGDELCWFEVPSDIAILKDARGDIAAHLQRAAECSSTIEGERGYIVFSLLVKLRKALHRGYLWNALEYLSQLRRLYMELLWQLFGEGQEMPTRAERCIERILPAGRLLTLAQTSAGYDAHAIAAAACGVTHEILLVEEDVSAMGKNREPIKEIAEVLTREFLGESGVSL